MCSFFETQILHWTTQHFAVRQVPPSPKCNSPMARTCCRSTRLAHLTPHGRSSLSYKDINSLRGGSVDFCRSPWRMRTTGLFCIFRSEFMSYLYVGVSVNVFMTCTCVCITCYMITPALVFTHLNRDHGLYCSRDVPPLKAWCMGDTVFCYSTDAAKVL